MEVMLFMRKKITSLISYVIAFLILLTLSVTGFGAPSNIKITDFKHLTSVAYKYSKFEISFKTPAFKGNCFDPDEIDIWGEFVSPSGKKYVMPAFWYQDYKRQLLPINEKKLERLNKNGIGGTASNNPNEPQGKEVLTKVGQPEWRIRFCPVEIGKWKYTIYVKAKGRVQDFKKGEFSVKEAKNHGFIRVEPKKKRHFVFDDGTPYIPIGQNVAWWTSPTRGSYDYNVWFSKMAESGANFARIWMGSWSFGLYWNDTGIYDFTNRLDRAYQLDKVLELAEQKGIYIMLTFINHGQFSTKVNPQWNENPWNKKNGGILTKPEEFFTNTEAKKQFKKIIRYIIARWGYSTNIMSWELFNEVSWTDNYDPEKSNAWHKEMALFIKSIDPYKHLVSSSSAVLYDPLEKVKELDFINIHDYGITNFCKNIPSKQRDIADMYNKPAFFCEMGIASDPTTTKRLDPKGMHVHLGLWAGVMGGGAGTGMTWWWDSYVHPLNLYTYFKPVSLYVKKIPWNDPFLKYIDEMQLDISNFDVGVHGYIKQDSAYLWFYDTEYSHIGGIERLFKDVTVRIKLDNGIYQVEWFDTFSGNAVKKENVAVKNKILNIKMPNWKIDIAFIAKKVK